MTDQHDIYSGLSRADIDEFKAQRLDDPWKRDALRSMSLMTLVRARLEQVADAELYRVEQDRREQ